MPGLDDLLATVLTSPKYRTLAPDLVRAVAVHMVANHRTYKDALKATKNKLHQVAGAYFDHRPDYPAILAELQAAAPADRPAIARAVLAQHASTRERLPILDTFFTTTLAGLNPTTVLDLACGLNPLAVPWMPLPPGATYHAIDVYSDLMAFLAEALPLLGIAATVETRSILYHMPNADYDLALLLKALPCLAQLDRTATQHLLADVPARYVLVSYPIHSLGGRQKGMLAHYTAEFEALVAAQPWTVQRFEFSTELAFLVKKIP